MRVPGSTKRAISLSNTALDLSLTCTHSNENIRCTFRMLLKLRLMEVVITTGATGCVKIQSFHHHQHSDYLQTICQTADSELRQTKCHTTRICSIKTPLQSSHLVFHLLTVQISRPASNAPSAIPLLFRKCIVQMYL